MLAQSTIYSLKQVGNLVMVRPVRSMAGSRPRGVVGSMSRFSVARLAMLLTSMELTKEFFSFITLTYAEPPDVRGAKKDLNLFLTKFRKKYRGVRYIWSQEFQERGCIHFHILTSVPIEDLHCEKKMTRCSVRGVVVLDILPSGWWSNGYTSVVRIDYNGGLKKYLFKEFSKKNQRLTCAFSGRWWGCSRNMVVRKTAYVSSEILPALVGHGCGSPEQYWQGDLRDKKTFDSLSKIIDNLEDESRGRVDLANIRRAQNGLFRQNVRKAVPAGSVAVRSHAYLRRGKTVRQ